MGSQLYRQGLDLVGLDTHMRQLHALPIAGVYHKDDSLSACVVVTPVRP